MNIPPCVITSRQNPRVKELAALAEKKERQRSGLFRFDGIKLFEEACAHGVEIDTVVLRESSVLSLRERLGACLSPYEDRILTVSDSVFDKLTEEKSPEGLITVAKHLDKSCKMITIDNIRQIADGDSESIVFLDFLCDFGNLGTVIRCAAALGVPHLVLSADCADCYHPRVIRAAMGGLFRVRLSLLQGVATHEAIQALRESGRRVLATALSGETAMLHELQLVRGDCFVIGNEGHGLSDEVIRACSGCVAIPMTEGSESLNAAMAATVCMWELYRQTAL